MQCERDGGVTFDSHCKIAISIITKSSCLQLIACHNSSLNHLIEMWMVRGKKEKNECGSQKLAPNEIINIQRMQIPIFNCHA